MNKLDMAMQIILAEIKRVGILSIDEDKLKSTWSLADLMQAGADKREQEKAIKDAEFSKQMMYALTNERPNAAPNVGDTDTSSDWQPDWSVAPDWANWWAMSLDLSQAHWYETKPSLESISWRRTNRTCKQALLFNYQGDWKQSLRKRPQ